VNVFFWKSIKEWAFGTPFEGEGGSINEWFRVMSGGLK
jgi:hypothetical protein